MRCRLQRLHSRDATGYGHTLAAFNLETGHKADRANEGQATSLPRAFLAEELDIVDLQQVGAPWKYTPAASLQPPAPCVQAQASPTPLLYALVGSATAARLERLGETADAAPRLPGSRRAAHRTAGGGGESPPATYGLPRPGS